MSRWRAMTDAELLELQAAGNERHSLAGADRPTYPTPDAAQVSVAGALYWAICVFWQDRPLILMGGVVLLLWQIGRLLLLALKS